MVKPIKLMSEHFVAMSDPNDREKFRFAPAEENAVLSHIAMTETKKKLQEAWQYEDKLEAIGLEEARCVLSTLENTFEDLWHKRAWKMFSATHRPIAFDE